MGNTNFKFRKSPI